MKSRALVLVLALWGCQQEKVVSPVEGGNPTQVASPVEGGNPLLAARIVSEAGVARPGLSVQLWEIADDSSHLDTFRLLGETRADSTGWVRFVGKEGIPWVMVVNDSIEGATLEGYGLSMRDGRIAVSRWGSVRGYWRGSGKRPSWVGLARLPLRANLQPDGSYFLPRVPKGRRAVVEGPAEGRVQRAILATVDVSAGDWLELDSSGRVHAGMLIDDFESPGIDSRLVGRVPQGTWNFKAPEGDTSRVEPGSLKPIWFDVTRMSGGDGRGKAWKVRVENDSADSASRGGVVLEISKTGLDASNLDSLSFRMRGNGRFQINFIGTRGSLTGVYPMPSIWGTVVVRPGHLLAYGASQREVLGSLVRIEWIMREKANSEFWLDDIVAWGWRP